MHKGQHFYSCVSHNGETRLERCFQLNKFGDYESRIGTAGPSTSGFTTSVSVFT